MKKTQLSCLASLLAFGIANAASVPCDGFKLQIKNETADNFLVHKIKLDGADIQPGGIQELKAHTEQAFTINNSAKDVDMSGSFEFHSISVPTKKTTLSFDLKNVTLICEHEDKGSKSDYELNKTRLPGSVTYTVR